jgi:hypothetical protein
MILGKDFMEEALHEVNFSTNILQLPNCYITGLDHNDQNCTRLLSRSVQVIGLVPTVQNSDKLAPAGILGEEQWEIFTTEAIQDSIFGEDFIHSTESEAKSDGITKLDKAI